MRAAARASSAMEALAAAALAVTLERPRDYATRGSVLAAATAAAPARSEYTCPQLPRLLGSPPGLPARALPALGSADGVHSEITGIANRVSGAWGSQRAIPARPDTETEAKTGQADRGERREPPVCAGTGPVGGGTSGGRCSRQQL